VREVLAGRDRELGPEGCHASLEILGFAGRAVVVDEDVADLALAGVGPLRMAHRHASRGIDVMGMRIAVLA
jgi:hypothetical protein